MKKKFYPLLLATFLAQFVTAQSPGGVGASALLTLWVQPSGITSSVGLVQQWNYSNNANNFQPGASANPNFVANAINFYGVAGFTGSQYMTGPNGGSAPITATNPSYTAFIVWQSTINNNYQRMWYQRDNVGNDGAAFAISTWNNGDYGDEMAISPYQYGLPQPYTVNNWHVSEFQLLNQNLGDLLITDETNFASSPTVINTDPAGVCGPCVRSIATQYNTMGLNFDFTEGLNGDIAEIIVYNGPLTGAQSTAVFSYLSLKYGISLGGTLSSSASTTIWDAVGNSAYNNQVFGIGTDNTSGLATTQGNNSLTGVGNGSGVSGMGNVILGTSSAFADQTFLFAGNNAGSLVESPGGPASLIGFNIFGRIWKVQNTNSAGNANVSIDYTGLAPSGTLGVSGNFRMLVDPTGAGDFTTSPTIYTPSSFSGAGNAIVNYSNVALTNGSVFTFGSSATDLPVNWVSFTANTTNGNDIQLNWTVADNAQAKNYVVQHSLDGTNFTSVGTVDNDADVTNYSYLYTGGTPGAHYFRILETDANGQTIYSKIVSANIQTSGLGLRIISNPIQGNVVDMELTAGAPVQAYITVLSADGGRVMTQVQSLQTGTNRSQLLLNNLAAGNYILEVRTATSTLHQTFVKL